MPMVNRRDFLWHSGGGLGGIALASLLQNDASAKPASGVKAKRVVQLFMAGAASHVDLFDYKPALKKYEGKPWDPGEKVELFQSGLGSTFPSPWAWKPYGKSGKHLSEIAAPLRDVIDEIAFIHSMVGKTGVHSTATLLQA